MQSNSSIALYFGLQIIHSDVQFWVPCLKRGTDKIPELNGVGCIYTVTIEFDKQETDVCRIAKERLKAKEADYTDDPKNQDE